MVRDNITIIGRNAATQVAFKNCAQTTKYTKKINGRTTDNAEDLNLVISMYNVLDTTARIIVTGQVVYDFIPKIENVQSFKYKAKLLGDHSYYRMVFRF